MKEYNNKLGKLIKVFLLVTILGVASGCSIFKGIGRAVTWPFRAVDERLGVHNDKQQTDLGPRRQPVGNPQGGFGSNAMQLPYPPMNPSQPMGGMDNMYGGQMQPPPTPPMPQGYGQQDSYSMQQPMQYPSMNSPQPMGGMDNMYGSQMQPPSMPSMPQYPNPLQYPSQGMMPDMQNMQAPQGLSSYGGMQQMPPQQIGSNPYGYGANGSMPPAAASGVYSGYTEQPPIGTGAGGPPGMDAETAYRRALAGGSMGGGMEEPQQRKKSWWSWVPFVGKYKEEQRVFEPMAEEFTIPVQDDEYVEIDGTPWRKTSVVDEKEKSRRATSMFPLAQYAPKPTTAVKAEEKPENKVKSSYPRLGAVPKRPSNVTDADEAAAELERLMKESEKAKERNRQLRGIPPQSANVKAEHVPVEMEKALNGALVVPSDNAMENDKEVIKQVPQIASTQEIHREAVTEAPKKKGFLSGIFGKKEANTKDSHIIVRRKSLPPMTNNRETTVVGAQDNMYNNVPIDTVEPSAGGRYAPLGRPLPRTYIEKPEQEDQKNSVYGTQTYLPKSRYTDRRMVPQTDE